MCAEYGAADRATQTVRRDIAVEVKIGVQHTPREIVLESGQSAQEVERAVADALAGKAQLLSLTDDKGRKVLVPAERIAYVEIGEPAARRVGFGALCAVAAGRAGGTARFRSARSRGRERARKGCDTDTAGSHVLGATARTAVPPPAS
ncbi:DUF3107 domain-containing protein [Streptomyces corynorhini]|uniref:DUF3107 domain-containing protein n=1 Tax=Streptomyces corynorhini TaxID=2282652 RepID=A0A370B1W6_9ACTN|nr:DUF3107 domain-containing protein [Streptomyces corynorhini]